SQAAVSINNAFMYEARIEEIERSMDSSKLADIGATSAGVAHEAKNALGSIHSFAQILELKKDDKTFLAEHVDMVSNEVERMRVLMEGVVDFSSGNAVEVRRENIKIVIEETIVLVRDQAKSKGITLEKNLADGLFVNVNKNNMKQIFLNLFINALDAMEKGGKLLIEASASDGKVAVLVGDTGCGIPEGKLEKIFEPFYSTKPQGTGLGLAIIKKAVAANGGAISVKSETGKGTVFKMIFKESIT
ncbi:MAG: ATP-binding protein, partial [Candidatus Margulisiibacteriota bacterium]